MKRVAGVVVLYASLGVMLVSGYEMRQLPLKEPPGRYDFFMHDGTIRIVRQNGDLFAFVIHGDSLVRKERLPIEGLSEVNYADIVSTSNSLACLYENSGRFHLYEQLAPSQNRTTAITIPTAFTRERYLVPYGSTYLIIFGDFSKRFTLSSHSLEAEYSSFVCCRVSNGVASNLEALESGRGISHSLSTVTWRDTLYAVWERTEHRSFLSWVTAVKRSIVFATYDGSAWSIPEPIWDIDEREVGLLGLYELNGQLFCFLTEEIADKKSHRIIYLRADDRKHWSTPVELMRCSGYVKSWLAQSDGNGKLHVVLEDTHERAPAYATFDGSAWQHQYDLKWGNELRLGSLTVDRGRPYLFYGRRGETEARKTAGSTTEKIVTEEGDTVSVWRFNPDETSGRQAASVEWFVLSL